MATCQFVVWLYNFYCKLTQSCEWQTIEEEEALCNHSRKMNQSALCFTPERSKWKQVERCYAKTIKSVWHGISSKLGKYLHERAWTSLESAQMPKTFDKPNLETRYLFLYALCDFWFSYGEFYDVIFLLMTQLYAFSCFMSLKHF